MMYQNKFVVAIKVGGKVLRENNEQAFVPFGSEYSIFLRNLDNRRASVKISIDDTDVLNGDELVVNGNSSIDLERFFSDSMFEGRRFKFIERTGDIEQYRGIKAEDGIIRVEFCFEEIAPMYWNDMVLRSRSKQDYTSKLLSSRGIDSGAFLNAVGTSQCNASTQVYGSVTSTGGCAFADAPPMAAAGFNDAGITVEGSKSNQSFHTTTLGVMSKQSHVIVLQLKGVTPDNTPVSKPITVKTKKTCSSCGSKYDSSFEYCPKDATYLKA